MYELIDTTDNDSHDTGTREEMQAFAAERNAEEGSTRWIAKPYGYSERNFKGTDCEHGISKDDGCQICEGRTTRLIEQNHYGRVS